jgi:DNA-binding response OmpR family regulator
MLSEFPARVLCVDDDEESRDLLTALMRFSGIEVEAVATAAQALSLTQDERFDLYVLDACLPDLDGFELCRRLRESNSQTPIVFFSSAGNEVDKKRGIKAGANAYTTKPDVDELFGSIARFVLCAERNAA